MQKLRQTEGIGGFGQYVVDAVRGCVKCRIGAGQDNDFIDGRVLRFPMNGGIQPSGLARAEKMVTENMGDIPGIQNQFGVGQILDRNDFGRFGFQNTTERAYSLCLSVSVFEVLQDSVDCIIAYFRGCFRGCFRYPE